MAIDSYTTLKTAVTGWMERSGNTEFVAEVPTFIQLAEKEFDLLLPGYQREVTTTLTTDAEGDVALPSGFISIKSVYNADEEALRYQISGSTLKVGSSNTGTLTVTYLSTLTPLSDSNASNWLLVIAPQAYLFMSMAMGEAFLQNWQAAAGLEAKANDILNQVGIRSVVAQYGRAGMTLPVRAQ